MKRIFEKAKRELAYYRALLAHPKTPRISRWLLAGAIAYFLSPIDLIPDAIPILGQLDDLLIVPGLIYGALAFIPPSVKKECRDKAANIRQEVAARKLVDRDVDAGVLRATDDDVILHREL